MRSSQLVFEGVSVDIYGDGDECNMDATVVYKQAALNVIAYLMKIGYIRERTYLLLSAAPVESHDGAIEDVSHLQLFQSGEGPIDWTVMQQVDE
ncbi:hypothetical protein EUX98_g9479 [Antrodiella citrinella]|uniref:Uncharacterized protein n=1 Tax=Antrodiella citrinella TaxID=2447956 RepID=A0A4S4LSI1_9APHY|nr:hypothetical protein EUX98_g9479 [Antrodiella citrinella]